MWAVLHDPELYPQPFTFDPERFVHGSDASGLRASARAGQPDPNAYIFGFGRRKCPGTPSVKDAEKIGLRCAVGIQFAEPALLLSMACILHAFVITTPESSKTVAVEFTTGITRCVAVGWINFKETD